MANNNNLKNEERMAWSAPQIRRLRAGAAEQGSGPVADGGPTTAPRS